MEIIGRLYEINELDRILKSEKSEFVTVFGRRRVGKTYLIRKYFNNNFTFHVTGLDNKNKSIQIDNFYKTLLKKYKLKKKESAANDWFGAFQHLIDYLEQQGKGKKVLFFDELPWMATAQGNFVTALEHFWNHWASGRNDVVLIVCGSAASWIIKNILQNKGGLHNRVTRRIKVVPFTLSECELFLKSKKFNNLSRYDIVKLYMVFGGIPFYLDLLDNTFSISQNIDRLCFSDKGLLRNEFNEIYSSIFKNSDKHTKVVKALTTKGKELTRLEILNATKLPNAGSSTKILEELEESGFITKYTSHGKSTRDSVYHLTDFFTIFHFKFIARSTVLDKDIWTKKLDHPSQRAWSGYTYELVCLYHIDNIKKSLGITGIETQSSIWHNRNAQIDLLIDRRDNVVSICEVKFSTEKFLIDKKYFENLQNKIAEFRNQASKSKSLQLVMITTYGLQNSKYNSSIVHREIVLDELF